jgi:hypothetical protein
MQGREFLQLAREQLAGGLPRHRRGAMIHAYYALLLECREAMDRWGLPPLTRLQVHAQVRLRLFYSTDSDLQQVAKVLEDLGTDRNRANYDLSDDLLFAVPQFARDNVQAAEAALALLDAIDADPVRRAAAIASIRP